VCLATDPGFICFNGFALSAQGPAEWPGRLFNGNCSPRPDQMLLGSFG
jgi:hypothetical protein